MESRTLLIKNTNNETFEYNITDLTSTSFAVFSGDWYKFSTSNNMWITYNQHIITKTNFTRFVHYITNNTNATKYHWIKLKRLPSIVTAAVIYYNVNRSPDIDMSAVSGDENKLIFDSIESEITRRKPMIVIKDDSNTVITQHISELTLNNINIDFTTSRILFPNWTKLNLYNSRCDIPWNPKFSSLKIKSDYDTVRENCTHFNTVITSKYRKLTISITSMERKPIELGTLFANREVFNNAKDVHLNFGNCNVLITKQICIEYRDVLEKIRTIKINKLNLDSDDCISFISMLSNIKELRVNIFTCNISNALYLAELPELNKLAIKGGCAPDTLWHKLNRLENWSDITIDFTKYSWLNLDIIVLAWFEYNKKKKEIVLYGEANLSFYNDNNKNFIIDILSLQAGLSKLRLCNFDVENIDYLAEIVGSITDAKEIIFDNLNISTAFVEALSRSGGIKTTKIVEINNITYLDDHAQDAFTQWIKSCSFNEIRIKSVDNIIDFYPVINKGDSILIEDIYDIFWKELAENIGGRVTKIEIVDNEISEQDRIVFEELIKSKADDLEELAIKGDINWRFMLQVIKENQFKKLRKLSLKINGVQDKDKVDFILSWAGNFANIKEINMELYSWSRYTKQEIYKTLNTLLIIT